MEWLPAGWAVCLPMLSSLAPQSPEVLFWHWLTRVVSGKRAIKRLCVCVCMHFCTALHHKLWNQMTGRLSIQEWQMCRYLKLNKSLTAIQKLTTINYARPYPWYPVTISHSGLDWLIIRWLWGEYAFSAWMLLVVWQEGHPDCKKYGEDGGGGHWLLVSPDGVAPSWMVGVSASVNLPLHHKVQQFSSGTGSPR